MSQHVSCDHKSWRSQQKRPGDLGEGRGGKDAERNENRRRMDRQRDGRVLSCFFLFFFWPSRNSQIYFICNEQMAPEQRTETMLPTHATCTADIDVAAL